MNAEIAGEKKQRRVARVWEDTFWIDQDGRGEWEWQGDDAAFLSQSRRLNETSSGDASIRCEWHGPTLSSFLYLVSNEIRAFDAAPKNLANLDRCLATYELKTSPPPQSQKDALRCAKFHLKRVDVGHELLSVW